MSTPIFEPELDQPLPRQVAMREQYGCGIWLVRLLTLPLVPMGACLIFVAVSRIVMSLGVLLAGTDVDGRIVRKFETKTRKNRVHYTAEYVYTVDQIEYQDRVRLDAGEYAAVQEGQAITVKVYAPGRECGNWPGIAGYSPLSEVSGVTLVALILGGAMFFFLYRSYVRPWRMRHLVRWGRPIKGIVRDVHWTTYKWIKTFHIRYEYAVAPDEHSAGGVFSGRASASGMATKPVNVGSVVTVLYDPQRPKRSLMYRLAGFKALAPR